MFCPRAILPQFLPTNYSSKRDLLTEVRYPEFSAWSWGEDSQVSLHLTPLHSLPSSICKLQKETVLRKQNTIYIYTQRWHNFWSKYRTKRASEIHCYGGKKQYIHLIKVSFKIENEVKKGPEFSSLTHPLPPLGLDLTLLFLIPSHSSPPILAALLEQLPWTRKHHTAPGPDFSALKVHWLLFALTKR